MVIYRLFEDPIFPHPHEADADGLLALGGDLSPERLLVAYSNGIFPWFNEDSPILWWSPDPRMVLFPSELIISRSLARTVRKGEFDITYDTAFERVITACATTPRPGQDGTWIVPEMVDAYIDLHCLGFAHSVEAWQDGELAGGLYGVAVGRAFFGESMFWRRSNASKVAFVHLVERLRAHGYHFIDCQQKTAHLASLGARPISRGDFLLRLSRAVTVKSEQWLWTEGKADPTPPAFLDGDDADAQPGPGRDVAVSGDGAELLESGVAPDKSDFGKKC